MFGFMIRVISASFFWISIYVVELGYELGSLGCKEYYNMLK